MINSFNYSNFYSIDELHSFFEEKAVSPASYFSYLINQTKKLDPFLNIYISLRQNISKTGNNFSNFEYSEKDLKNDVFNGVPFNIKDCFLTKEFSTTYGVKGESVTSEKDSFIVQLFKDHGARLLGKTSIPPYAYDVQTYNDIVGTTKNPWNLEYSAGGSTGGGAVSVATGLSPFAIGSDFAGSIRIPAHFCGIKGYIPTKGRNFLNGHYPDSMTTSNFQFHVGQIGFLSNFLSDFKHIFFLLNPKKNKISGTFDANAFNYSVCLQEDIVPVASEIKLSLQNIVEILKNDRLNITFDRPDEFSFKDVGKVHAELMRHMFDKKHIERPQDVHNLENLIHQRRYFEEELTNFMENRFWIMPVCPTFAIPHNLEHKPILIDNKEVSYWRAMIHYVKPFNITTNPIVTIPVSISQTGLPIGIQIIGPIGKDIDLLNFAEYLITKVGSIGHPVIKEFS